MAKAKDLRFCTLVAHIKF